MIGSTPICVYPCIEEPLFNVSDQVDIRGAFISNKILLYEGSLATGLEPCFLGCVLYRCKVAKSFAQGNFLLIEPEYLDCDGLGFVKHLNLSEKKLDYVNLAGADLSEQHLYRSSFKYADLQGADLRMVDAQEADFESANMRGANLQGSFIDESNMEFVDLSYANLRDTTLSSTNMGRTNLTGANLQGADLTGVCFNDAILLNADFNGAKYNQYTSGLSEAQLAVMISEDEDEDEDEDDEDGW